MKINNIIKCIDVTKVEAEVKNKIKSQVTINRTVKIIYEKRERGGRGGREREREGGEREDCTLFRGFPGGLNEPAESMKSRPIEISPLEEHWRARTIIAITFSYKNVFFCRITSDWDELSI